MNISKCDLAALRSDVRRTGFASAENLIDVALLKSLREEASTQRGNARRVYDDGVVSYKGYLADLGKVARAFLTGRPFTRFLRLIFDQSFALTESSSCYTYYEAGDFLSAHRDGANDCEVTVLVYLDASSPNPDASDTGLMLQIYEDHAGKPASLRHVIKTRSGSVVAGRGSREWHGRPPLLDGERVALLTACFSSTD